MMINNGINDRQNQQKNLDLIAAWSLAYRRAKMLGTAESLLAGSAAAIGFVVAKHWPDQKGWSALLAIAVLVFDVAILESYMKELQGFGANLQELFDSDVLQLPPNRNVASMVGWGDQRIVRYAERFKKKKPKLVLEHRNWYPLPASLVSIECGRLICQRENMTWDSQVRKELALLFLSAIVLLAVVCLGYGLHKEMKVDTFVLAIAVPVLPTVVKLIRVRRSHVETADASETSQQSLRTVWDQAMARRLSSDQLLAETRSLEDGLYDRRRRALQVPEWYHRLRRSSLEKAHTLTAAQMAEQAARAAKLTRE
jgi:hypothetical protein